MEKKLIQGGIFLKYGRSGSPHDRAVWCSVTLDKIFWGEPKQIGKDKKAKDFISSKELTQVLKGQVTPVFLKQKRTGGSALCFSLYAKSRSLDLECKSEQERDEWVAAFSLLLPQDFGASPRSAEALPISPRSDIPEEDYDEARSDDETTPRTPAKQQPIQRSQTALPSSGSKNSLEDQSSPRGGLSLKQKFQRTVTGFMASNKAVSAMSPRAEPVQRSTTLDNMTDLLSKPGVLEEAAALERQQTAFVPRSQTQRQMPSVANALAAAAQQGAEDGQTTYPEPVDGLGDNNSTVAARPTGANVTAGIVTVLSRLKEKKEQEELKKQEAGEKGLLGRFSRVLSERALKAKEATKAKADAQKTPEEDKRVVVDEQVVVAQLQQTIKEGNLAETMAIIGDQEFKLQEQQRQLEEKEAQLAQMERELAVLYAENGALQEQRQQLMVEKGIEEKYMKLNADLTKTNAEIQVARFELKAEKDMNVELRRREQRRLELMWECDDEEEDDEIAWHSTNEPWTNAQRQILNRERKVLQHYFPLHKFVNAATQDCQLHVGLAAASGNKYMIVLLLRGYPQNTPIVLLTQPRNCTDDRGRRLVDIGANSRLSLGKPVLGYPQLMLHDPSPNAQTSVTPYRLSPNLYQLILRAKTWLETFDKSQPKNVRGNRKTSLAVASHRIATVAASTPVQPNA